MKARPRSQGINSLTASGKVPWEALLIGSWQLGAGWFCWWRLIWVIFRAGLLGSMIMCYFSLFLLSELPDVSKSVTVQLL